MPSPTLAAPWGSKSTMSTLRPYSASAAARLIVVVVLPTPPFWLHIATIRAGPWRSRGAGTANSGRGRPTGSVAGSVAVLVTPPNLPRREGDRCGATHRTSTGAGYGTTPSETTAHRSWTTSGSATVLVGRHNV